MSWVNLYGLHDTDLVQRIGAVFDLHPLTLEDIVSPGQRPRLEVYDGYIYIVLQILSLDEDGAFRDEQLSLVLTDGAVLTFQERLGDGFGVLRERIRQAKGRIRRLSVDYLTLSSTAWWTGTLRSCSTIAIA